VEDFLWDSDGEANTMEKGNKCGDLRVIINNSLPTKLIKLSSGEAKFSEL
jgi:hypothetical protein